MSWHELVEEWDGELRSSDPLGFPGYATRLAQIEEAGGVATAGGPVHESVRTGRTEAYVLIENDFEFLGGSMGAVHGEKVVRAFRRATELRLPVVVLTRSGGARMQEGMVSLVQMARTAAAQEAHRAAGLLSVAVHLSPTTGGVFASYGSLCDVRAAQAGAIVGFAGPRVATEVTGVAVGDRSHVAERAFEAGLVDALVEARGITEWVEGALGLRDLPLRLDPARGVTVGDAGDDVAGAGRPEAATDRQGPGDEAVAGRPEAAADRDGPGDGGDAWREVQRARRRGRPSGIDVAAALCTSWTELAGTDPVTRAGLATVDRRRVVVVAHDRYAGAGRPTPAGFRLAQRACALASRLDLPLLTLIDTPGAEPGWEAEQDGVAGEIARTFAAWAATPVRTVAVCVGEGGSGGALALGAADRLLIQEHAIFSVIGPEGAAAILERDAARAPEVAAHLRLTSSDLLRLGVVDEVVPDELAGTLDAIRSALASAVAGDRQRRFDAVTAAALRIEAG